MSCKFRWLTCFLVKCSVESLDYLIRKQNVHHQRVSLTCALNGNMPVTCKTPYICCMKKINHLYYIYIGSARLLLLLKVATILFGIFLNNKHATELFVVHFSDNYLGGKYIKYWHFPVPGDINKKLNNVTLM